MKKRFFKIISVFTALVISLTALSGVPAYAISREQQIQNDINKLKNEKNQIQQEIKKYENDIKKQQELKTAIEKQISITQKEIDLCNQQISSINSKISANKAEIDKKNKQIEADKLEFKKRLRAIYMSSSDSNVQILLGAEDFSQFLQLSQLTASVSAHDKLMIENIVKAVKTLEEKQVENNKLLEEQKQVKNTVAAKQKELNEQSNKIQGVISSINSDKKDKESEKKQKENAIKEKQNELNRINSQMSGSGSSVVYSGGAFAWPTPGVSTISSPFGERWSSFHEGVDISNGTFGGKIVAIADGKVEKVTTGCTHNYRKSGNIYWDKCGGGYGNYVIIDHGKDSKGIVYKAWYAHMSSVAVSLGQTVKRGQVIGYIGSTGYSTGPHLHFGLKVGPLDKNGRFTGTWKNPMSYYSKVK